MSPVKFHDNTAIHWYLPEVGFRTPHRYKNIQIYVPYIKRCSICIWSLHSLLCILSLLLLSHFSSVQLCATPETAAHQAPPSLGFSRQEHWSELPFPSPIHERERWKWNLSVVSNSQWPHGPQPTRLLRPWDFPGESTGVGCHCLLWLYL